MHLVDTAGKGVEEITEAGVIANGKEYELDCIIFATGFEVGTGYTHQSGYDVTGRDGITLSEKWAEGMRTLHGRHTHGFPNLLIMTNGQSAFTTNFPHAMDETARHISYILNRCREDKVETIEAEKEAEDAWVEEIISLSRLSDEFQAACTPGYYNNEGQPNPRSRQNGAYGKGPNAYFRRMEAWREEGRMAGLRLKR